MPDKAGCEFFQLRFRDVEKLHLRILPRKADTLTGPVVIYNEHVLPLFVRERLHEIIDDPRRQEHSKTLPVCFHAVQEAVQSIF